MRSIFYCAALILGVSTALQGQEKNSHSFQLTDFSISTGIESYFGQSATDNFLLDEVGSSSLIPANFDDYQRENYQYTSGSGSFEIMAGFAWRNSEEFGSKIHRRLRLGLSYSQPALLSTGYFLNQVSAFDTLTSGRTGNEFYIDSTFNSNLGINYNVSRIALNTAFLWTTDDNSRVSFYGGVNLSLAMNFSSRVNLSRHDYSYLSYENGVPVDSYSDNIRSLENGNESYRQNSSFGFGFSSPIGLDWRMGKQGKSLNDVHLFAEVRPGVSINSIPEYELISQFRNSLHLGLRFSI
jgi:hypothetical protein